MDRPRILIADDALVAEELKNLIEPEYQVIGVATDEKALLSAVVETKPDVVLMDMDMSLRNGSDLGRELKKLVPGTKLILLAINGAVREELGVRPERAVGEVLRGHSYVTPSIAQKLINEFIRSPQESRTKELTTRQRQVLQLLAEGRSMKEAAVILNIAVRTIAFHKYRIMDDFGLKTNSDLVRFAMREHLISDV